MSDKFLWVECYQPHTVQDCILPEKIKTTFLQYVNDGQFPNLILAGPAGSGKTSSRSVLFVMTSMLTSCLSTLHLICGIGDVRTQSPSSPQPAVSQDSKKLSSSMKQTTSPKTVKKPSGRFIEEFQNHCRFILTCNYPYNIIEAIHSRCTVFTSKPPAKKNSRSKQVSLV